MAWTPTTSIRFAYLSNRDSVQAEASSQGESHLSTPRAERATPLSR